jgi:hypothetical protein
MTKELTGNQAIILIALLVWQISFVIVASIVCRTGRKKTKIQKTKGKFLDAFGTSYGILREIKYVVPILKWVIWESDRQYRERIKLHINENH